MDSKTNSNILGNSYLCSHPPAPIFVFSDFLVRNRATEVRAKNENPGNHFFSINFSSVCGKGGGGGVALLHNSFAGDACRC